MWCQNSTAAELLHEAAVAVQHQAAVAMQKAAAVFHCNTKLLLQCHVEHFARKALQQIWLVGRQL
jgi:hypothetical protein